MKRQVKSGLFFVYSCAELDIKYKKNNIFDKLFIGYVHVKLIKNVLFHLRTSFA